MKPTRQSIIMEIISENDIETQNQLMEALAARGIKSTQATLSRDIKDMRLVKELGGSGKYRYTASGNAEASGYLDRLKKIFRECVTSYATAQNLIIIKTLPGLANAACSTLDSMDIPDLVGSLAGDDTAFLAMTDSAAAEHLCREISRML